MRRSLTYILCAISSLKSAFSFQFSSFSRTTFPSRLHLTTSSFSRPTAISHASPSGNNHSSSSSQVNLEKRTLDCLDFEVITDALRNLTVTQYGRTIASERVSASSTEVNAQYSRVEELSPHVEMLPIRSAMNIWPIMSAIEFNTAPPSQEDLAYFTHSIEEVNEVRQFLVENQKSITLFNAELEDLVLPEELTDAFLEAFDDDGNLNGAKYPVIGKLRKEMLTIRGQIVQTMNSLLRSQLMKDKLADSGFIEYEGRFCLMLKNTFKKGVGIVHSSSNTGRSLYVEPMEVVEPTNEMKSLGAQLKAEENRILFEMCRTIFANRGPIEKAIRAVGELDVVKAKAKLGKRLAGVVPQVEDEGTIICQSAKHPILLLRGVDARGNDFELSKSQSALVISGPNAGGKTIVLKTAGLFALMVRHAIPLPVQRGARFDLMHCMADIGDMQTVSGRI